MLGWFTLGFICFFFYNAWRVRRGKQPITIMKMPTFVQRPESCHTESSKDCAFCTKCGRKMKLSDNYCDKCGQKAIAEQEQMSMQNKVGLLMIGGIIILIVCTGNLYTLIPAGFLATGIWILQSSGILKLQKKGGSKNT